MAKSLSKILLHLVFGTKNRHPWITVSLKPRLHAYLASACRSQGVHAYRVGGTNNHVHVACTLSRTLTVSKLTEEIKKTSSAWMKKQDPSCENFTWQAGYGAFSLGQSQLETLIRYIDNQEEHHRKRTFREEYIDLLEKYRVDYDSKHLWD